MNNNSQLSFNDLRMANIIRLPQFKNAQGGPAHSEPDGSDWSPNDWMTAVTGEVGEAANILKKIKRGDYGPENSPEWNQAVVKFAKELADVVTYVDLLAYQFRLDLGAVVSIKFNEVSDRVEADVKLTASGVTRTLREELPKVQGGLHTLGIKNEHIS